MNAFQNSQSLAAKCKDKTFYGDVDESVTNTIRDFDIFAVQRNLSDSLEALFFVNILRGPSRTFYTNYCHQNSSFEDIKAFMRKEFDYADRQKEVQISLDRLDLRSFMVETEVSYDVIGL